MHKPQTTVGTILIPNNTFFKEVREILCEGKDVLFTINGNSMYPFLSHGDKVLLSTAREVDLTYGKIILANSNYGYVLHRLVWKNSKTIWLAGDNNLIQIERIDKEQVLGYVKYALVDGKEVNVRNTKFVLFSLLWFLLRPFRLIIYWLKKVIRNK